MGNETTNFKSGKSTGSNLKVPPIKIVLSSHQNNAVVNVTNQADNNPESEDKNNFAVERAETKESERRINDVSESDKSKRSSRSSPEHNSAELVRDSSPSGTSSSGSDRPTSTSPSSESESLASNSTIVSDSQQTKCKVEQKSETSNRREKTLKFETKSTVAQEKAHNNSGRKIQDPLEQSNDSTAISSKEQSSNASQRITRSSQRAAQQSRTEGISDTNGEDQSTTEIQDKNNESARKVKRRKGEQQESEGDGGQANAQPTLTMANICPADYQLPPQNSFELYRDIRERPYKKMLKLNHVQPKVPLGFKDYLLNSGPYLLDGNKLGAGLSGIKMNSMMGYKNKGTLNHPSSKMSFPMKLSNLHHKLSSYDSPQSRHSSYSIPKPSEVPKNLQVESPLYLLFLDQEKARQQMRMQHLKERERSILASEQEILRAYNRIAIADSRQELHLSACTYFYYQERYHYVDEKTEGNGNSVSKEVPHSQDNSFLCIDGGDAPMKPQDDAPEKLDNNSKQPSGVKRERDATIPNNKSDDVEMSQDSSKSEFEGQFKIEPNGDTKTKDGDAIDTESKMDCTDTTSISINESIKRESVDSQSDNVTNVQPSKDDLTVLKDGESKKNTKKDDALDGQADAGGLDIQQEKVQAETSDDKDNQNNANNLSDDELKVLNKKIFLDNLQEIDEKWAKIRREMLVRHKNEADSLYAVQSLEWEWKAKETGVCDVRDSLKIEPESVPRVEVSVLDY